MIKRKRGRIPGPGDSYIVLEKPAPTPPGPGDSDVDELLREGRHGRMVRAMNDSVRTRLECCVALARTAEGALARAVQLLQYRSNKLEDAWRATRAAAELLADAGEIP